MLYLAAKLSAWFLLPILTIKFALALEKDFRFKNLTEIAQNTAKLNLLFGLLYVLAIFMKWVEMCSAKEIKAKIRNVLSSSVFVAGLC